MGLSTSAAATSRLLWVVDRPRSVAITACSRRVITIQPTSACRSVLPPLLLLRANRLASSVTHRLSTSAPRPTPGSALRSLRGDLMAYASLEDFKLWFAGSTAGGTRLSDYFQSTDEADQDTMIQQALEEATGIMDGAFSIAGYATPVD